MPGAGMHMQSANKHCGDEVFWLDGLNDHVPYSRQECMPATIRIALSYHET
jgi:hypothetical protein